MKNVMELLNLYTNYSLYLPESFEWLILKSDAIPGNNNIKQILDNTYNYVDSCKYMSWEQYFTQLLKDACNKSSANVSYNKSKLHTFFRNINIINKILGIIDKITFIQ